MRFPEDYVGQYLRSEIDRDIGAYSADFHSPDHRPLILVALEILRKKGRIAVLDGGCGTGKALWGLKDQLKFRAGIPLPADSLRFVGVSKENFSQESEWAAVRKAIRSGELEYLVGDLRDIPLPGNAFDIITLYEVLIHNSADAAEQIVNRLYEVLKPEGWLFASVDPQQFVSWKKLPGGVFSYTKTARDGEERMFLVVQKN